MRDRSYGMSRSASRRWAAPLLAVMVAAVCAIPAEAGSTAAQVSFTYGVLAFAEGDDEEAARRFAEAARNDPDEGIFLHWLALADLRQGRAAQAVLRLEESLKARWPPATGRARVEEDLRLAREALAGATGAAVEVAAPDYRPEVLRFRDLPRWNGRIALESGWDSNPDLVTEEEPLVLPGEGASSDAAASLYAEAGFHPFHDRRGWSLGLDLAGSQSKYREKGDRDLAVLAGAASLAWGRDSRGTLDGPLGALRVPAGQGHLALLLQAGGSWAGLSRDPYRSTVDLAASLFVHETPATTTRIGVSWSDRDFSGDGLPRLRPSGEELAGSVDHWLFFGRSNGSLRLGAAAGRYDADRLFERTFREVSAEAAAPLAARWTLYLTGEVREDDYAHPESSLAPEGLPPDEPRQDTTWRASAMAAWRATERLSWSLRASQARRESNVSLPLPGVALLDYERTVVSLGVEWLF